MSAPLFRFDTNSPYAYLAAARVDDVLGPGVFWQPVAFGFMLAAQRRVPWSMQEPSRSEGIAICEARAAERGLPPFTWPPGWPRESWSLEPLRAIEAARAFGRERGVTRALFRRNFVTGEGVHERASIRAAWIEAGLDPGAFEEALAAAKAPLRAATDAAIADGVPGVPTVTVAGRHFWGDDRLEHAAAVLA